MELLSKHVDVQYTPAQVEKSLRFMFQHLVVDCVTLQQTRLVAASQLEEKKYNLKLKSTAVIEGRPRLRDKLRSEFRTKDVKSQADARLSTWDSMQAWLYLHQFPNTLSGSTKHKLYFMASQVCLWFFLKTGVTLSYNRSTGIGLHSLTRFFQMLLQSSPRLQTTQLACLTRM